MDIEEKLARLTPEKETLLTIGVFDGVHLGHQRLIDCLKKEAEKRGLISGVVTFEPHPQQVLCPESRLPYLDDLESRVIRLRELGVGLIVILSFDAELAKLEAREFIRVLQKYLRMRGLIVGPDFALGRDRVGNLAYLQALGREMDFTIDVIPPVVLDGKVVSSTIVREALAQGDMERVRKLVGRSFTLSGQVVPGASRGRVLGFPTANLDIKPGRALPKDGVYAGKARINNGCFPSVANIGIRPTFGSNERLVEIYLLDYFGELYGQKLKFEIVARLRDEKQFATAAELRSQIERDVEQARKALSKR